MDAPIVTVDDLTVSFGNIRAVEGVSFEVQVGDIYAIVGESGCGKSTLAYSLLNLIPPPGRITSGEVRFRGRSMSAMTKNELKLLRGPEVGMVFQAAMNSFNPVTTIGHQVDHMLEAHGEVFPSAQDGRAYFEELLGMLRLSPGQIWRAFEHQLSGGMKQRVAIAVALLLQPSVLVLDEPTTALDVLNQRLILELLQDLHKTLGVTIVIVTHDLAIVAELATHVTVMYAGRLVESGTVHEIFAKGRRHPYVAALISAIPSVLDEGLHVRPIAGQVPNLADLPSGCRFAPRCQLTRPMCHEIEPPLVSDSNGHAVACHVVNEHLAEEMAG
jgi:oligopeptide/dipeptide ABC transporter ATP-binding protein